MQKPSFFADFDPNHRLCLLPSGDWVNPREINQISIGEEYTTKAPNVRIRLAGAAQNQVVPFNYRSQAVDFAADLAALVNQLTARDVPTDSIEAPRDKVEIPALPVPPPPAKTLSPRTMKGD